MIEHDLSGKLRRTFPDHALVWRSASSCYFVPSLIAVLQKREAAALPFDRLPRQPSCASSQSALKHRELDHAIFNFAACQSRTSDSLERVPMLVEIAEGLILCSKRRLEAAHLPNSAERQDESNGLSLVSLGLGHDPDIFGHSAPSQCQERQIRVPTPALPADLRTGRTDQSEIRTFG